MAKQASGSTIGNRIAPPKFIIFVLVFIAGIAGGNALWGWRIGTMAGFDAAAGLFLLMIIPVVRTTDAGMMRQHAAQNDANRALLLVLTGAVMTVVLITVAAELGAEQKADMIAKALIVATLALAWLFSNVVFSLHYAHLFYGKAASGKGDYGGLEFEGDTKEPLYWDFIYFAFTLGMTFQTSDTGVSSPRLRKIVTFHSFAAFVFNIGVLAFTINVLGS